MLFIYLLLTIFSVINASNDFSRVPKFQISNSEILIFVEDLRQLDENQTKPSQIELNYQGHTMTHTLQDNAKSKLFKKIDESLFSKPTYKSLLSLHDNYIFQTGNSEDNTNVVSFKLKICFIRIIKNINYTSLIFCSTFL